MYIDKLLNYQNIYHNNHEDDRILDLMDEYELDTDDLKEIMCTTTSISKIEKILGEEITLVADDPSEKMFHAGYNNPEKEELKMEVDYKHQYPYLFELFEDGKLIYKTIKTSFMAQKIGVNNSTLKNMFKHKDIVNIDRKVIVKSIR